MKLSSDEARGRFASARVARLATVAPDGAPHLVPLVFAVDGNTIHTAVDAKPKSTLALQRLANIAANPRVTLLVDHYVDDWTQLWWARADGVARIIERDTDAALRLLTARYPQYEADPPPGAVIAVDVIRWSGWSASEN